jgi:tritrans,polycis-undecaprenyl-diphosphate synthase [geranylgeranyl-diphosphate specific]
MEVRNGHPSFFSRILYKVYEKKLEKQIRLGAMPRHLAIILDGNRRYAENLGINPNIGHELGYMTVEKLIKWCWHLNIPELTLFAFSTENFNRDEEEVEHLMDLLKKGCQRLAEDPDIHENRVKVKAIGRLTLLPLELQEVIRYVEERTKNYDNFHLNIAISYGGRAEIVDAFKTIFKKVLVNELKIDDINEEMVNKHLYVRNMVEPDMIIRTSGEQRLSNFLLWQAAYSELYFEDANLPAFRRIDFFRAIRTFQNRNRRYGK